MMVSGRYSRACAEADQGQSVAAFPYIGLKLARTMDAAFTLNRILRAIVRRLRRPRLAVRSITIRRSVSGP